MMLGALVLTAQGLYYANDSKSKQMVSILTIYWSWFTLMMLIRSLAFWVEAFYYVYQDTQYSKNDICFHNHTPNSHSFQVSTKCLPKKQKQTNKEHFLQLALASLEVEDTPIPVNLVMPSHIYKDWQNRKTCEKKFSDLKLLTQLINFL